MTSKVIEIQDEEIQSIGNSDYVLIPAGWKSQIGIKNTDGSKKSEKIKRALMHSTKHGFFVAIWGEFQQK